MCFVNAYNVKLLFEFSENINKLFQKYLINTPRLTLRLDIVLKL